MTTNNGPNKESIETHRHLEERNLGAFFAGALSFDTEVSVMIHVLYCVECSDRFFKSYDKQVCFDPKAPSRVLRAMTYARAELGLSKWN